jgi:micrococcal nuclease
MQALFLLLLLSVPLSSAVAADPPRLEGTVVGVIDGDTLDLRLTSGMIRVRLHAIDTPERGQAYGRAARDALSRLVFDRSVQAEPFEQDRYDRLVARIWREDLDVNAEMIRQGYAWAYRRYAIDPAYCRFELAAREQGLGLWQSPDYSSETLEKCVAALGKR